MAHSESSNSARLPSESGEIWITTRTGIEKSAGRAPSNCLRAETPPDETPMATALNCLSLLFRIPFPIDLHPRCERLIALGNFTAFQTLLRTQAEKTTRNKTAVKKSQDPILKRLLEINHDIAAQNQVHLTEICVHRQIVSCKDNIFTQGGTQNGVVIA